MSNNNISDLIQEAMHQLKAFGLSEGTLKSYGTRAFQPILRFYAVITCGAWETSEKLKPTYKLQE